MVGGKDTVLRLANVITDEQILSDSSGNVMKNIQYLCLCFEMITFTK